MTRPRLTGVSAAAALVFVSMEIPGIALHASPPSQAPAQVSLAGLWSAPDDVATRDLFFGRGGAALVPSNDAEYEVIGHDTTGYSSGYEVRDQQGRKWDVKLGNEAQPELVASRVLWAIGYHQPAMHFVPGWRKRGDKTPTEPSARFRLSSDHDNEGEWAWADNPFAGSRELRGLLVANLVLNNWDLKDSNNRIYEMEANTPGPRRWFVVQDLGAALGRPGFPIGSRNDVEGFESQNLLASSSGGALEFEYGGRHRELLEGITADDVAWICGWLARLSDKQWADAFRAATYSPDVAQRFIAKLKAKVAEGVAAGRRGKEQP
jgi:hypothetical protein